MQAYSALTIAWSNQAGVTAGILGLLEKAIAGILPLLSFIQLLRGPHFIPLPWLHTTTASLTSLVMCVCVTPSMINAQTVTMMC